MTRGKRTPSEDFDLGYQAGWAGRGKHFDAQTGVEIDRLDAKTAMLEARLDEATKAKTAAEKALAAAEKKLAKAAKSSAKETAK